MPLDALKGQRLLLKESWNDYATHVLPATCPQVQRVETRRAFYAGAASITKIIAEATDMPDHGAQVYANVLEEMKAFAAEVEAGIV